MSELTPPQSELKASQSAEVILYFQGENKKRISIGQAATQAASPRHSITGDKMPALTPAEMMAGLDFLERLNKEHRQPTDKGHEPSEEEWEDIERLADQAGFPYNEARQRVLGRQLDN